MDEKEHKWKTDRNGGIPHFNVEVPMPKIEPPDKYADTKVKIKIHNAEEIKTKNQRFFKLIADINEEILGMTEDQKCRIREKILNYYVYEQIIDSLDWDGRTEKGKNNE